MVSAAPKKGGGNKAGSKASSKVRPELSSMEALVEFELAGLVGAERRKAELLLELAGASGPRLAAECRLLAIDCLIQSSWLECACEEEGGESMPGDQNGANASRTGSRGRAGATGGARDPDFNAKEGKAVAGLIKEVEKAAADDAEQPSRDFKTISALQRYLHVAMASTGTLAEHARLTGQRELARVCRRMTDAGKAADLKLTQLAMELIQTPDEAPQEGDLERDLMQLLSERNSSMAQNRYRDDDFGYAGWDDGGRGSSEGRSRGGRHSAEMQERDEYGRFSGDGGGYGYGGSSRGGGQSRGGWDQDDGGGYSRGSSRGGSYGGWDDDNRAGGYEGRSRGGRHSAEMQERDEYGRFTGDGGSSRGGWYQDDYDSARGGSRGGSSRGDWDDGRGGGYDGRSRGGRHSAQMQDRDEYGQFTGSRGSYRGGSSRGDWDDDDDGSGRGRSWGSSRSGSQDDDYITDSAGRHYSRESWERAQEGRALGGQHSHGGGRRSSRDDGYDDDRSGSRGSSRGGSQGGGGSRGGGYTDSAGRHYSRESWERAQEGRALGGQHSHGGGRGGRGGGRGDRD